MKKDNGLPSEAREPLRRAQRSAKEGLTLIEILIALIVMLVGLTGILAMFPPTLESARVSMQETTGAFVAESAGNAIAASFDLAPPGGPLTITHDSENSLTGALVYYQFALPLLADGWVHHPGAAPAGLDPEQEPHWRLAGDPWTRAQLDEVKALDGSEPLDQFAYSFDVRKLNTLEYLALPPAQLEPLCRTYEARIHVFRLATGGSKQHVCTVSRRYVAK
jgi:hypothetical protein